MSRMLWREANRCRWVGIRPAHEGEQVTGYDFAANQTKVIYTVPAGKTLYLCNVAGGLAAVVVGNACMILRSGGDNYYILAQYRVQSAAGISAPFGVSFPIPIEVPAGDTIVLFSSAANLKIAGSFFGWVQ